MGRLVHDGFTPGFACVLCFFSVIFRQHNLIYILCLTNVILFAYLYPSGYIKNAIFAFDNFFYSVAWKYLLFFLHINDVLYVQFLQLFVDMGQPTHVPYCCMNMWLFLQTVSTLHSFSRV